MDIKNYTSISTQYGVCDYVCGKDPLPCNSLVCCQPPTGVFATQKTQDVTVTQESKKYTIIFIILYEIYYIHRKILSKSNLSFDTTFVIQ